MTIVPFLQLNLIFCCWISMVVCNYGKWNSQTIYPDNIVFKRRFLSKHLGYYHISNLHRQYKLRIFLSLKVSNKIHLNILVDNDINLIQRLIDVKSDMRFDDMFLVKQQLIYSWLSWPRTRHPNEITIN